MTCSLVVLASAEVGSAARPNIILLLADDQAKYTMGCYAAPEAKTPNLDRLAADGVVFDRHYVNTAICMASRATILTGKYEYRTGCNFDSGPMLREIWEHSYPQRLRQAGYRVAFAGKFGLLVAEEAGAKGRLPEDDFDSWGGGPGQTHYETHRNESMSAYAEEYPHSTLSYGAFARDFIRSSASADAPFCLSISFKAPHHPTTPDPRFDDVYDSVEFTKPKNYGREYGSHFSLQSRQGRQYERFHSWHYSDQFDSVMATYYQQIYAIDYVTGWIRDVLAESGVADNTIVIYTSDNGFMCGSHGYGSKVLPYEESSSVPLILYDPRGGGDQTAGRRIDALTCNTDIAPTILAYAGLEAPQGADGRDLAPLISGSVEQLHAWLPLINVWGPKQVHSLAVVTQEHKLIFWPYGADGLEPTTELYDMTADRLELRDLSRLAEAESTLDEMQQTYAVALEHWAENAVSHHHYRRFAKIFDPHLSWQEKAPLYLRARK